MGTFENNNNSNTLEAQRYASMSPIISRVTTDRIFRDVREMVSESRLRRDTSKAMVLVDRSELSVSHLLGTGAFSQVHHVSFKNRVFAMKHVRPELLFNKNNAQQQQQDNTFRLAACELAMEAHFLASLSHPNILEIHGWAANGVASLVDGHYDSFFLLLEPLTETLDQRLARWRETLEQPNQQQQPMSSCSSDTTTSLWNQWRLGGGASTVQQPRQHDTRSVLPSSIYFDQKLDIIISIASALSYLHSKHIIYRDLKPNNIGFSQDSGGGGGRVQLFDFGLSRELPSSPTTVLTEPFEMSGKVGTLRYMACEVATYQPYTVSADVYSWAMVAYETLTLQKPFQGWTRDMHSQLVCGQLVRPDVRLLDNDATMIEMQPYIVAGWHAVPSRRPSMSVIAQHLQQLKALQQHKQHLQPHPTLCQPQASVVSVELPPDFGVRQAPIRSVSNSTKTTISTTSYDG